MCYTLFTLRALALLEQSLKNDEGNNETFLTYLGQQFLQFSTLEMAFFALKQLCQKFPNDPAHLFNFAYLLEALGQTNDAIR
jgi:tetratricopeptide (TPR) repeat protein